MPLYEFVCSACGRSFEDLVRYEAIGGAEITRKVSRFASRTAGGPAGAVCESGGT